MTKLSEQEIEAIARRIVADLEGRPPETAAPGGAPAAAGGGMGMFATVDEAVAAAVKAQPVFVALPLAQRARIVAAIRATMLESCEALAQAAYRETGLGRAEDKIVKNRLVTERTAGLEELYPQAVTGDHGLTLTEPAPFGVIGCDHAVHQPDLDHHLQRHRHARRRQLGGVQRPPSRQGVLGADGGAPQPRDHRRRRPAQRRHLRLRPDDRVGAGADAPPRRASARRHRWRRGRQGGDGLGQAGDLRRPRQPAGSGRRDRRRRQGRPRHRPRRLHRQQHHLRRREGDDLRRVGRRPARQGDDGQRRRPHRPAPAAEARGADLHRAARAAPTRGDQQGADRQERRRHPRPHRPGGAAVHAPRHRRGGRQPSASSGPSR